LVINSTSCVSLRRRVFLQLERRRPCVLQCVLALQDQRLERHIRAAGK
jgi:hypothetical protein